MDSCGAAPGLVLLMQKVESELRQAQEAFGAGEKRMDASKQELGRLRRTADNARKETQTAREEVNPQLASPHYWPLCCTHHKHDIIILLVIDWNVAQHDQLSFVHNVVHAQVASQANHRIASPFRVNMAR